MIIRDPGRRHGAICDAHVPKNNPLLPVMDFFHDKGCDYFVVNGDFLNLEWASHWNEAVFKEIGDAKLREMLAEEMLAGREALADLRDALGKKCRIIWIPGNHEAWLSYAVWTRRFMSFKFKSKDFDFKADVAAMLDAALSELLAEQTGCADFGVEVLPYNEPLRIGDIVYLHGHQFTGADPTAQSARKWAGTNLVMGHHHTETRRTLFNGGDPRKVYQHTIVPAMTGLAPGYLVDKSTRWLNGFWTADFNSDGLFDGRVVKVFDGKCVNGV